MALNGIDISNYQRGLDLQRRCLAISLSARRPREPPSSQHLRPVDSAGYRSSAFLGALSLHERRNPIAQAKFTVASCRNYFGNGVPVLDYEMYRRIGTDKGQTVPRLSVYDQTEAFAASST